MAFTGIMAEIKRLKLTLLVLHAVGVSLLLPFQALLLRLFLMMGQAVTLFLSAAPAVFSAGSLPLCLPDRHAGSLCSGGVCHYSSIHCRGQQGDGCIQLQ